MSHPSHKTPTQLQADPLATWLKIKELLRPRIPADEFRLWLMPAQLMKVMGGDTLLIALPRNGKAVYKAMARKKMLQTAAERNGFGLTYCMFPEEWEIERMQERYPNSGMLQAMIELKEACVG